MSGNQLYIYSAFFTIFCCLLTSLIGFIKRNSFKELKLLPLYPLLSGLQISISIYFDFQGTDSEFEDKVDIAFINLFLLVEFFIIYRFYKLLFESTFSNRVFTLLSVLYPLLLIGYWTLKRSIFLFPADIFIIHSIVIIIPALLYLIQLPHKSVAYITNEPSFWIIIGIVSYFGCTIPLFLLKDFIFDKEGFIEEDGLYAINFICYSIMFLFIARAYLCKQSKKNLK